MEFLDEALIAVQGKKCFLTLFLSFTTHSVDLSLSFRLISLFHQLLLHYLSCFLCPVMNPFLSFLSSSVSGSPCCSFINCVVCCQVRPWLRCSSRAWKRTSVSWPSWTPHWPLCSVSPAVGSPAVDTPERTEWRWASLFLSDSDIEQIINEWSYTFTHL